MTWWFLDSHLICHSICRLIPYCLCEFSANFQYNLNIFSMLLKLLLHQWYQAEGHPDFWNEHNPSAVQINPFCSFRSVTTQQALPKFFPSWTPLSFDMVVAGQTLNYATLFPPECLPQFLNSQQFCFIFTPYFLIKY